MLDEHSLALQALGVHVLNCQFYTLDVFECLDRHGFVVMQPTGERFKCVVR